MVSTVPTRTVTLKRGFVDPETSIAHKEITFRAPLADDEITADAKIAALRLSKDPVKRREASSETLQVLALVAECTQSLGAIQQVTVEHLRALSRRDAQKAVSEFYAFEDEEARDGDEEKTEDEEDDAEGND